MRRVRVIDSHTGGEPTRLVIEGGPDLGSGSLAARRDRFARDFDGFRSAVVEEPRGSDVFVGALLEPPTDPGATAGVIFFNNVGPLHMCGHGTIGLVVSLAHLGRLGPGVHRIETPVGLVTAELHVDGAVSVENVPSHRHLAGVEVDVPGLGRITGDVAWGGNWFFLSADHGLPLTRDRVDDLLAATTAIRRALERDGITGADGAVIDHVELFGPSEVAHAQNFVLCPGLAYDRSPCGTGTSAKLACLAADGALDEGEVYTVESIVGSRFEGRFRRHHDIIVPIVTGRAWVTADSTLLLDPDDPFCWGLGVATERGREVAPGSTDGVNR
jgi:proline racemase